MKVSVKMITYNHEKFIAQAIEGVLMQETDFPFELVIGEDCSTDGTREIVVDYAQRYPDRIRALLREKNLGMRENGRRTREACRGEYIALCEGDDYWTDPLKLQKQVEFLEAHPECTACLHDVLKVYEDGTQPTCRRTQPQHKHMFELEDVLKSTISQTASIVYRRDALPERPDWAEVAPLGDWALTVLLAQRGSLGYVHEQMSVWRAHSGGVWTGIAERDRLKQMLHMYDLFDAQFGHRYGALLERARAIVCYGLALDCWVKGLREEEAHWMSIVRRAFPEIAEQLGRKALNYAHEIERCEGFQKGDDAVQWTCDSVAGQPTGRAWCNRLRSEWYAGYAYKAHKRGDAHEVRRASWRAFRSWWRQASNRGFLWRWISAIVGGRTWASIKKLTGRA